MTVFNRKELKSRRRYLRNNMTKAEVILWQRLKHRQLSGFKFRRQASIRNYIVDFYCPLKKLVIELDGTIHGFASRVVLDKARQREIESLGINVVRFTNDEVVNSTEGVLQEILRQLGAVDPVEPLRS